MGVVRLEKFGRFLDKVRNLPQSKIGTC